MSFGSSYPWRIVDQCIRIIRPRSPRSSVPEPAGRMASGTMCPWISTWRCPCVKLRCQLTRRDFPSVGHFWPKWKFHHVTKSWDVMCFNVLLQIVITVAFVLTSSHSLGWNYHLLQRCPGPEECQVGWQASQCSELDTQRVQKIGAL